MKTTALLIVVLSILIMACAFATGVGFGRLLPQPTDQEGAWWIGLADYTGATYRAGTVQQSPDRVFIVWDDRVAIEAQFVPGASVGETADGHLALRMTGGSVSSTLPEWIGKLKEQP